MLHLLSDPPPPLFSTTTILISCYATLLLMSFFNPLLLRSLLLHLCLSPQFIVTAHFLFSLSLCRVQYYDVQYLLPFHLSYFYMVFDCSCIVCCSIQPLTKCLSPQFFLCLCIFIFLRLVIASLFIFHPPPPSPYFLYVDCACCIF